MTVQDTDAKTLVRPECRLSPKASLLHLDSLAPPTSWVPRSQTSTKLSAVTTKVHHYCTVPSTLWDGRASLPHQKSLLVGLWLRRTKETVI